MFDLSEFQAHFAEWAKTQPPFKRELSVYSYSDWEELKQEYPVTECGEYLLIPYTESADFDFVQELTEESLKFDNYASSAEWDFNRLLRESGYPFIPTKKEETPSNGINFFTDSLYDKD
jgi:hypothetical protein